MGQFCTKPGLLFLPSGHGLDDALAEAAGGVDAAPVLYAGIGEGFAAGLERLRGTAGVEALVSADAGDPASVGANLVRTTVPELLADPRRCWPSASARSRWCASTPTTPSWRRRSTPWRATSPRPCTPRRRGRRHRRLVATLETKAGRVLFDGWPTGVAVTWAMQHGGPYPSTVGSIHTSVGVTAARRWQRPICYQDAPQSLLPETLRDGNPLGLSRRVDGQVTR